MNPDWLNDRDGLGRDGLGRDGSPSRPDGPQSNENGGFGETALPRRKILRHEIPSWVPEGATRVDCGQWWPRLVLFMPDHLHALMVFPAAQDLPKVVRDWKRYTARNAGIRWQRDFFDHRIRNEQSLEEKWHYVAQNPVRAGLVVTPEDWPYVFGSDPVRIINNGGFGETALPKTHEP
jgi:hypothetical protein